MIISIITLILLIVTTVTGLIHMSVYIHRTKLPKITVCFPGGATKFECKINQQVSIPIHFTNIGENTITGGDVCVYVPNLFLPLRLRYLNKDTTIMNKTINDRPYGKPMLYLYTGKEFSLIHNDEGEIQLDVITPDSGAEHHFKVHFISDQGEGGTHDLIVKVT